MNLREQFEKETGNKLINCNTEDAVLKYWIDYSKWLEQRFKEQVEVLTGIQYAIEECRLDNGGIAIGDRLESRIKEQLKKSEL